MAQLLVRKLDDGIKERLRQRAKRNGRSLEAEAREILEDAAMLKGAAAAADASEKGFGTLMQERFAGKGLTANERKRFHIAICEINDRSAMRIPDFDP